MTKRKTDQLKNNYRYLDPLAAMSWQSVVNLPESLLIQDAGV